jgi:hypothetical protein
LRNPFAVFLKNGLPLQFPKEKAESCSRMIRQQYSKGSLETVEIIREEMIQKKNNKMKNEFAKLCNKCINGTDTRFTTYDEPIPPVRAN